MSLKILLLVLCCFYFAHSYNTCVNSCLCSGHGNYSFDTQSCICEAPYCDSDCSLDSSNLPENFCSILNDDYNNWIFNLTTCECQCTQGWSYTPGTHQCDVQACNVDHVWSPSISLRACNDHGLLIEDNCTCICDPGWTDNLAFYCAVHCVGITCQHGGYFQETDSCDQCTCPSGYCGALCENVEGASCGNNATWDCTTNSCQCTPPFFGEDCNQYDCTTLNEAQCQELNTHNPVQDNLCNWIVPCNSTTGHYECWPGYYWSMPTFDCSP